MELDSWVAPNLTSGLGNRLFQYAAAAGLAEKLEIPLVFSKLYCQQGPHGESDTIFKMYPHTPIVDRNNPCTFEIKEAPKTHYEFSALEPLKPLASKILLRGFRQNPHYFPNDLKLLKPNWIAALGIDKCKKIESEANLSDPEERARTISLHVRLGDYRILSHHKEDLKLYYSRALTSQSGYRVHLFSDEPHLCEEEMRRLCESRGFELTIAKVCVDIESLYEMSLCLGGNITANSTFSWWGAWFARSEGSPWATYPSRWGKGMPDPTGIIPAWGKRISVV